jgi:hypothetical protein
MKKGGLLQANKQEKPGQVTHGIHLFLKSGKISPSVRGFKRIQKYLRDLDREWTAELMAKYGKLTIGHEVLLKTTLQALGVWLLIGAYSQRYSVLRPDMARRGILELQPCLGKQAIAFLNSIRQNVIALGLDVKQMDQGLNLQAYIADFDEKKAKAKAAGQGKAGGRDPQARVIGGDQAQDEDPGAGPSREGQGQEGGDE